MPSLREIWRSPDLDRGPAGEHGPYYLPEPKTPADTSTTTDAGRPGRSARSATNSPRTLVALMVVGISMITMSATILAEEASSNLVAADVFERSGSSGWGIADSGQRWKSGKGASSLRLGGGSGVMTLPTAGGARRAILDTHMAHVGMRFAFSLDGMPSGDGVTVMGVARKTKAGAYQGRVRIGREGRVWLSFREQRSGGTPDEVGPNIVLGWRYQSGQTINVKFQTIQKNSTQLRLKVWPGGSSEPAGWQLVANDTSDLESMGRVGVRAFRAMNSTGSAVNVRFEDVRVARALDAVRSPATRRPSPKASPKDSSAPKLLDIDVVGIHPTSARVRWTLDEPATGFVKYGPTRQYASTTRRAGGGERKSHRQDLTGLQPDTTYNYSVVSVDKAGNRLETRNRTFTTAANAEGEPESTPAPEPERTPAPTPEPKPADTTPPAISAIEAVEIGAKTATITWSLDEPATGQVEYGPTNAYGSKTKKESGFDYSAHSQRVSGLDADRTYHYRIVSEDRAGNRAVSEDQTFTTPADQPTPAATPAPTPAATPAPTPAATPAPTPAATPAPTPAATPAPTPAATPAPTPAATPAPTPAATPAPTPAATPAPTPAATPAPTPAATPAPTPAATPAPTPAATPAPTPAATPAPTPAATPAPTPAPTGEFPTTTSVAFHPASSAARPGYLQASTDPTFGTRVMRISDEAGVRHRYASKAAWNADGTLVLLDYVSGSREMRNGRTYDVVQRNVTTGQYFAWSNVDAQTGYSGDGLRIARYHVNADGTLNVVHRTDFSSVAGWTSLSFGGGQGSPSKNDRMAVSFVRGSEWGVAIVDLTTTPMRLVAERVIGTGGSQVDNVGISQSGTHVVVQGTSTGSAVGQGTWVYSDQLASRRLVSTNESHWDACRDANGNDLLVIASQSSSGGGSGNAIGAYRMDNGAYSRVLDFANRIHISCRNVDRPGWAYVSSYSTAAEGANTSWAGYGEAFAVRLDGTQRVQSFAHLRHTEALGYNSQPQVSVSPDGQTVIWASEWGGSAIHAYVAYVP